MVEDVDEAGSLHDRGDSRALIGAVLDGDDSAWTEQSFSSHDDGTHNREAIIVCVQRPGRFVVTHLWV